MKNGISRLKERRDVLKDKLKDFAKSVKVGAIAMNIVKAFKDGEFKDKQALLSMLHVTSKNLNRMSVHGHRYLDTKEGNEDYKEFTKDYYYHRHRKEIDRKRTICYCSIFLFTLLLEPGPP